MKLPLSHSRIVSAFAHELASRISQGVIRHLCRLDHALYAEDSPLKSIWDEICFQEQSERSIDWEVLDDIVCGILAGYVDELSRHEREALWVQTDASDDWDEDQFDADSYDLVSDDDIINYIAREYVYAKASNWTNSRIREFIDRYHSIDWE
ncbi:hypothetical protein [Fundidesulfovibrio soli]|uniref:hypothetical protein n=1 Tax=Fundidesulfovibrio soli TaxID=2922716 RepID=UPI001FB014D7|nr:hypothetical protein [Fundidesulfovibrio soli]